MKSRRPLLQLTSYYFVLFAAVALLVSLFPSLGQYSPIGGTEHLPTGVDEFITGKATRVSSELVS